MICLSDSVLIVASTALLITGMVRWQGNLEQSTQAFSQPSINQPPSNAQAAGGSGQSQGAQSQRVVVVENPETTSINVANDANTQSDNDAFVDLPGYGRYIVVSGDSLSAIALRFGTTVADLQRINGIEGSLINVGQELRYPPRAN